MTQIKDVKLTADITEQPTTEYVTFWGKLKGDIEKQKDLHDILLAIKRSVNDVSTKLLRKQDRLTPGANITIEQDSEDKLIIAGPTATSELINDGIGNEDSEGNLDKFTTRSEVSNIADILNAKVEDVEFELNDKIYDLNSEVNTKQDKLTQGDGILIEQDSEGKNIISVKMGSMPGEGNLTVKLNGTTIVEFNANAKQDKVANIEIQTVPNAEERWGGKILGLNAAGDEYVFYDFPKELPDISLDASYENAILMIKTGNPTWVRPGEEGYPSNI